MSSIFISHSSRDNAAVAELKERLLEWGHGSVFLDFDPEAGIPPGRDWEQELYHQLRTCRAVLVLCSEHSMASHWCFAEITHAKSLGKHVFPLRIAECEVHPVLAGRQVLDLTGGSEDAYPRLRRALEEALGEGFPWNRKRPPYPGLLAFQEADAAVFFGRGEEIRTGLEALERLRRYGAGRALMALGASGSGKSSLVRAGWLPRLRRDERRWWVLRPIRPLDRPWRELAITLSKAFADLGRKRGWSDLQQELERAAAAAVPSPEPLITALRDLRLASGREEAKVLLTVDQAEELLSDGGGAQARFAPLLQAALASPDSPLMVIGTLRTDLLAEFQHHPSTRHLAFDDLRLGPMTAEALAEVVEGPARLADLDLEPGLAEAILDDAESEDALPLLAFALRELYERFGKDRKLTLEEYSKDLGGLGGAVAQAAESVLSARPLSAVEEKLFRDAMLSLARIDEEGRYARRAVRRADLPAEVHALFDAFVEARLLVVRDKDGEQLLEVAHEALFRSWGRLRAWLDEDREFLLWRKRLDAGRREWERTGRHASALLEGPALEEGRRWLEQRGGQLEAGEREFLIGSVRRAAVRRLCRLAAAGLAAAALALVAVGGLWLWRHAEAQRARAEDIARVAVARGLMSTDPTRSAQVLLEVKDPDAAVFATARMREVVEHRLADVELAGHRGPVTAVAFSPDGRRLLTASWDQTARLWRLDGSGEFVELAGHGDLVTAAAFTPGGERLLTVTRNGTVRVWPADGTGEPRVMKNPTERVTAAFGPGGDRVLAVARNGTARVWHLDGSDPLVLGEPERASLGEAEHFVLRAAFSPGGDRVVTVAQDGIVASWPADRLGEARRILDAGGAVRLAELGPLANRLLTVGEDGTARVWRLDGLDEPRELGVSEDPVRLARFSRLGDRLLTVTESPLAGRVTLLWDLAGGGPPWPIEGSLSPTTEAEFGPGGERLVLVGEAGDARVWSAADGAEDLKGHAGGVLAAVFSPRGERLATASEDGSARLWKWGRPRVTSVLRGHSKPLIAASFSPAGDRVLTASLDGTARIWPLDGGPPWVLEHDGPVYLAAFDPEGERVLTVAEDGNARLWPASGGEPLVLANEDGIETAAFDPRGERIATTSWTGGVKLWRADAGGDPVELGAHEQLAVAVAFSPDGRRLVTASLDGTARVWALESAHPVDLRGHEDAVLKAAFSPDGTRVVTASRDATARVWNADGSGEPIVLRGHTHEVVAAAFSPDGRRVVTGSNDSDVRIWNLEQPGEPIVLSRHSERITRASFSPGGRHVVSASGDGTAMVWRADGSGDPLVLAGHADAEGRPSRVTAAAFSPDGARVVTAAEDATARLWLISFDALQQAIASAVSGCLRPELRRDHLGETLDQARRAFEACRRASR